MQRYFQSMQKISRAADVKSGDFAAQSKNIFISGYKQVSLCLLCKMNENRVGRITKSVYGVIRSMNCACLQKWQYISQ